MSVIDQITVEFDDLLFRGMEYKDIKRAHRYDALIVTLNQCGTRSPVLLEKGQAAAPTDRHNPVRAFVQHAPGSQTISDGFNPLLILTLMSFFIVLS
ncbi:hypothetical protein [Mixta hanseatica]|uniref:Uncharacterized protein n=1 Tax=Mixta hanseatica TaxID=2872648 RepID=A0ABY4RA40_9GAMM|nr:hypothetical protein [Mixta hanseatica]UQY44312.1 hypothetical protein K6958_00945 [Mixta hanseatica]